MEGYDVECLDDHVSSDLYCIICLKLMRNAIQMRCGHGMCKSCFDGLVHSCGLSVRPWNSSWHSPVPAKRLQINLQRSTYTDTELNCPSCRKSVVVDEIMNVPMIDHIISSLKVKCSNNKQGCQWISKLETLESHFEKCEYAPVQCPNEMCVENVPRYEMEEHLKSCSYATVECIYCDFGCNEKVMRNDMDTHIKSSPLKHLEMMSRNIQEKDKTIERLQKENDCLQNQLHEMKQQNLEIIEFQKQLSKANTELKDMISQIPEYHLSVNALNEELKATRAKIDELNIGQTSASKCIKDNNGEGASVSVETESSQCTVIDDKEVLDSLKFIVFRGELFKGSSLSHSDIVDQIWKQFELEYIDAELQSKNQIMIFLKGVSDSIKTEMKLSSGYLENVLRSLSDKLKTMCDQHICRIAFLIKQLQYFQDNMIENFATNVTSLCIGKFRYGKEKNLRTYCDQLYTRTALSKFGDHQLYISQESHLVVISKLAKGAMLCHSKSLKTIAANKGASNEFVFESSVDRLKINEFIVNNRLLLKIQEK